MPSALADGFYLAKILLNHYIICMKRIALKSISEQGAVALCTSTRGICTRINSGVISNKSPMRQHHNSLWCLFTTSILFIVLALATGVCFAQELLFESSGGYMHSYTLIMNPEVVFDGSGEYLIHGTTVSDIPGYWGFEYRPGDNKIEELSKVISRFCI